MIKITLHCLPHELDQVAWIVDQLKRGARLVDPSKFILDFTLNVSDEDVNWAESRVSKEFCIDKFNIIFNRSPFINEHKVSEEHSGCNTVRRNALRADDNVTHIIGLDPDLLFPETILYYIASAVDNLKDDYYIITPQIYQLWDSSWDIISHPEYRNTPRDQKLWLQDPYLMFNHQPTDVKLSALPYLKFDGGWMTVYTKKLLQLVDIPDSLGHYGLDDTFVSTCSNILAQKGYNVKQYLIEDLIVMEDRVYRSEGMKPFIKLQDLQNDMRDNSHVYFQQEIEKFKNRV